MMGRIFVKPNPEVDLYVIMSSVTDLPVAWGSAEELLKEMIKDQFLPVYRSDEVLYAGDYVDALNRADMNGHSSRMFDPEELSWAGVGTIKVSDLEKVVPLLDKIDSDEWPYDERILKYIERWEDDD